MKNLPFTLKTEQDFEAIGRAFSEFCRTIAALRDPEHGCPWDLEQDHKTLRSFMIEEACEASQAMGEDDHQELKGELGDVLLQVVLNAQVAKDQDSFCVLDVISSIQEKMVRRHPHIFGTKEQRQKKDVASIKKTWDEIKLSENGFSKKDPDKGYFEKAKVNKIFPAGTQALKIGRLASRINFDWPSPEPVFSNLLSEIEELRSEWNGKRDEARVSEELGDIYFSLAQLCRHLKLDPEMVAGEGNRKFLKRFSALERLAKAKNLEVTEASSSQLEELWQEAKRKHPNSADVGN